MAKLQLYTASAGSGKTYTLVERYVCHALQAANLTPDRPWQPGTFRSALCVTFTKMATAEMKGRIVSRLYALAKDPKAHLAPEDMAALGLDSQQVRLRAQDTLQAILHDYSHLAVSTIDSFIQRMVLSLLWELDLTGDTDVTLDSDLLLTEASRTLLDHTDRQQPFYDWLVEHINSELKEGRRPDLLRFMRSFGYELFQEQYVLCPAKEQEQIFTTARYGEIKAYLADKEKRLTKEVDRQRELLINKAQALHLDPSSFAYKAHSHWAMTVETKLDTLLAKNLYASRIQGAYEEASCWFSKTLQGREALVAIVAQELLPRYRQYIDALRACAYAKNAQLAVMAALPVLPLLGRLRRALSDIERTRHQLLLADLTTLLISLRGEAEIPFIYEKMGIRYDSFFIDEFQDTSVLQWTLLKELVKNGLAQGGKGLLVGDVKQAIYRWRDGDWKLLATQIPKEFQETFGLEGHNLEFNYRSEQRVVEFNNRFFKAFQTALSNFAKAILNSEDCWLAPDAKANLERPLDEFAALVGGIYASAEQKMPSDRPPQGYVALTLAPVTGGKHMEAVTPEAYTISLLEALIAQEGIAPERIAVLVRRNAEARNIAHAILEYNETRKQPLCKIMTSEALSLDASQDVQTLLAALALTQHTTHTTHRAHHGESTTDMHVTLLARHFERTTESAALRWSTANAEATSHPVYQAIQWLRKLSTYPLLESFDTICAGLNLPSSEGERLYVATLRDMVYSFQEHRSVDVAAFLRYYAQLNASARNISTSGIADAVNILTIHKAKGLEYDVVLMPYCDWHFRRTAPRIWARGQGNNTHKPLVPIISDKRALNSCFAHEAAQELCLEAVDSANLLYVAFTRARQRLYAYVTGNKDLAKHYIRPIVAKLVQSGMVSREGAHGEQIVSWGTPVESPKTGTNDHALGRGLPPLPSLTAEANAPKSTTPRAVAMAHVLVPTRSFSWNIARSRHRALGETLHAYLGAPSDHASLDEVLKPFLNQGTITAANATKLAHTIEQMLSTPPLCACYNQQPTALVERDMVTPSGEVYRPDRVVAFPEKTVVIDLKFAKPSPAHKQQVRHYMHLLGSMGYPAPEGLLWYMDPQVGEGYIVSVAN